MPCIKAILCEPVGLSWSMAMTQAAQTLEIRATSSLAPGPRRACVVQRPRFCDGTSDRQGPSKPLHTSHTLPDHHISSAWCHASPISLTSAAVCFPADPLLLREDTHLGTAWQGQLQSSPL